MNILGMFIPSHLTYEDEGIVISVICEPLLVLLQNAEFNYEVPKETYLVMNLI